MSTHAQDNTDVDTIGIDTSSNQWVKIYNEKDTVTFSYHNRTEEVHEVFLDSSFCVIIYSDKYHFLLSAAYKSTVDGSWIVDFPYQEWLKNDIGSSVLQTRVHDLEIQNGCTLLITYSVDGPRGLIHQDYQTTDFPTTQELTIAQDGIYYLKLNFKKAPFYLDPERLQNSPRPRVIWKGKELIIE